jgi:hypothetical protein
MRLDISLSVNVVGVVEGITGPDELDEPDELGG